MFRRLLLVFRMATAKEQSGVDFGMKRLHAAAEHFGPAGEIGNVAHRDSRFAQQLGGSSGRENVDLERGQALGEFHDSSFIEHADKRALHRHECLHNGKSRSV